MENLFTKEQDFSILHQTMEAAPQREAASLSSPLLDVFSLSSPSHKGKVGLVTDFAFARPIDGDWLVWQTL